MRRGHASAAAMGTRMSGCAICASVEPSFHCTRPWTMLCGWIQTSMSAASRPNSQRASITSSPLFIIVAESTEILRPIFQLGWAHASRGVAAASRSSGQSRNGPPDAVSTIFATSCKAACGCARH